jgi:hypothetical protein
MRSVRRSGTLLLVAGICTACGSSHAAPRPLHKFRRYWQGFVRDTMAEHIAGTGNRAVRLTVEAIGRDGVVRRARLMSPVSPGWG